MCQWTEGKRKALTLLWEWQVKWENNWCDQSECFQRKEFQYERISVFIILHGSAETPERVNDSLNDSVNDSVSESVKEEGTDVTEEGRPVDTINSCLTAVISLERLLGKYISSISPVHDCRVGKRREAAVNYFEDRGIIRVISLDTFRERILRGKHFSFEYFQSQCRVTRRKRVCGMINFKLWIYKLAEKAVSQRRYHTLGAHQCWLPMRGGHPPTSSELAGWGCLKAVLVSELVDESGHKLKRARY